MREMKDSGIKWIGVIPSAWRTARVKNVAETMQSGGTPDSSNDTFYVDIEGGIPWVAIADMSTTPYVKDTNKHISEEGRKSKNLIVFEPGTILYAMYASVGKVSELAVPATINQALLAIVLNSSIDPLSYYWPRCCAFVHVPTKMPIPHSAFGLSMLGREIRHWWSAMATICS